MRPVVALYSTFLQRAFDQTVHDVCQNDLPVLIGLDRVGGQDVRRVGDAAALHDLEVDLLARRVKRAGKTIELQANEFRQQSLTAQLPAGRSIYNARVVVRVTGGTGRVTAYASVIDNRTQDPIYVQAVPAMSTWTHGTVTNSDRKIADLMRAPSRLPELTMSACGES